MSKRKHNATPGPGEHDPAREGLKKREAAFWVDVDAALVNVNPERGQRTGFDIARTLQGLLLKHGFTGGPDSFTETIHRYAVWHDVDGETLEADVFLCWDSVVCPEGVDPVTAALSKARADSMPEDFLSKAPGKVRVMAWTAYGMARALSGEGDRAFYLSARKLGEALNCSHMTAARVLGLLCREGLLQKQSGNRAARSAQTYRLTKCYTGT